MKFAQKDKLDLADDVIDDVLTYALFPANWFEII